MEYGNTVTTAEQLTAWEHCRRWGLWAGRWRKRRSRPIELLNRVVREAVLETEHDPGAAAAEHYVALAHHGRQENRPGAHAYDTAINHAAVADIVTTAIRTSRDGRAWTHAPNRDGWQSSALMNPEGTRLRQVMVVSSWTEARAFAETHSWWSLGEVAHFDGMPMDLVVAVVGPQTSGRRTNPWSRAWRHPQNSDIRFKLRPGSKVDGFSRHRDPVFREDHSEIARATWLEWMLKDGVLEELLFVVPVPDPGDRTLEALRKLAREEMEALNRVREVPPRQVATCRDPIRPCPYLACCWLGQDEMLPAEMPVLFEQAPGDEAMEPFGDAVQAERR